MRKQKIVNVLRFLVPVLIATGLWGSVPVVAKLAYQQLEITAGDLWKQLVFAGVQFFPAGLIVLAFLAIRKKRVTPQKKQWRSIAAIGLLQVALYYGLYYFGHAQTSSMRSTIINATTTFFSVGLAHLIGMDRLNLRKTIGCVLGFAGVVVLQLGGKNTGVSSLLGESMILLAAIVNSISKLMTKKIVTDVDPMLVNGWQLLIGGGVVLALGLAGGGTFDAHSAAGFGIIAYLVLVAVVAFNLWGWLLRNYNIGSVVVCSFLTSLFSAILSMVVLPEENPVTVYSLLSIVLICVGVIIVNLHLQNERAGKAAQKA